MSSTCTLSESPSVKGKGRVLYRTFGNLILAQGPGISDMFLIPTNGHSPEETYKLFLQAFFCHNPEYAAQSKTKSYVRWCLPSNILQIPVHPSQRNTRLKGGRHKKNFTSKEQINYSSIYLNSNSMSCKTSEMHNEETKSVSSGDSQSQTLNIDNVSSNAPELFLIQCSEPEESLDSLWILQE